ncbi:hypothetical protein ACR78F_02490 [Sphingobacterium spiritivorum]|uniref:hypothetical protein n=1 Tax=Sphingobacterium spiritivorum TaxID=258 RepID=UPI003DA67EA6
MPLFVAIAVVTLMIGCKKDETMDTSSGNGKFTFGSSNYSGPCIATPSSFCSGSTDVTITANNGANNTIVYNMPEASSGTFNLVDGWKNGGDCQLYMLATAGASKVYAATKGTLTKTGAKSYTFSITMTDTPGSTATTTVTGSGTY